MGYIIYNILTKRRVKNTPFFEYTTQGYNYIKNNLNSSKYLTIKKTNQCKATTKKGSRCQLPSAINGYCIVHFKTFID